MKRSIDLSTSGARDGDASADEQKFPHLAAHGGPLPPLFCTASGFLISENVLFQRFPQPVSR